MTIEKMEIFGEKVTEGGRYVCYNEATNKETKNKNNKWR